MPLIGTKTKGIGGNLTATINRVSEQRIVIVINQIANKSIKRLSIEQGCWDIEYPFEIISKAEDCIIIIQTPGARCIL